MRRLLWLTNKDWNGLMPGDVVTHKVSGEKFVVLRRAFLQFVWVRGHREIKHWFCGYLRKGYYLKRFKADELNQV